MIDTVLLKVASRCNIDCRYCYVYHSADQGWRKQPKKLSKATMDMVIDRLVELRNDQPKSLSVVLHGGEPLLLGKARLRTLLRGLRTVLGKESTIALQTNGTLLDNDLVELMAETRTIVGVSIDGPVAVNNQFRVDHSGRSTFSATLQGIERLQNHPQSSEFFRGVLAVIDPYSSPEAIYDFFKSLKVSSIDFLLRDGNYDNLPYGKNSPNSLEYGRWLARLWDLYVADPDPISIECLDNLVRGMYGGTSTKEGSGVTDYGILVVETDGSITKNDTLKNSYDGADRFSGNWSVHRNSFSEVATSYEFLQYKASQRTSHEKCIECRFLAACGGGMVLHRWSREREYDNPSVYCSDQMYICSQIENTFKEVAA